MRPPTAVTIWLSTLCIASLASGQEGPAPEPAEPPPVTKAPEEGDPPQQAPAPPSDPPEQAQPTPTPTPTQPEPVEPVEGPSSPEDGSAPSERSTESEVVVEDDEVDEDEGSVAVPAQAPDDTESEPKEADAQATEADEADPDSAEDEEEVDITRPPPRGQGAIAGTIVDPVTSEPLMEVAVTITDAKGQKSEVVTDLEGRYRADLPPGKFTLRAFVDGYRPMRVDQVLVERGAITNLPLSLETDEAQAAEEEHVVEAELAQSSVEGQNLERQRSVQAKDAIGRAEIAKSPAANAAQAAQRVVGANIVDGRFVYVRGLGERYTNGLLNGSPVPSPEPDRAAVPLDLFPSLVLESVSISKTFTPDMPADFAGGSVNIVTRTIPDKFLFGASVTGGYRVGTTFHERLNYRGSATDFLGFDNGLRALPGNLPGDYRLGRTSTRPDGEGVTVEERVAAGRSMNTYMTTTDSMAPPDHGLSMVVGNGWDLGRERRVGAVLALHYSRSFLIREEKRRDFTATAEEESGKVATVDYDSELGRESVRAGAYGSLAYQFSPRHILQLTGLASQLSDDDAVEYGGANRYRATNIRATRLRFVSRSLWYGQLRGTHELPELNRGQLNWNLNLSTAGRYEPDTRDTVYQYNAVRNWWGYVDGSDSGKHFWADQSELVRGGGLDYSQPLTRAEDGAKLKFGGLLNSKDRKFRARRFALRPILPATRPGQVCAGESLDPRCVDGLFRQSNIDSEFSESGLLWFSEFTRGSDSYDAGLDVYAGYAMAELPVTARLRGVVGGRLEVTRQEVLPANPLGIAEEVEDASLHSTDLLPAVTGIYRLSDQQSLRATVSKTLARPQLRELAPFTYTNYFGGHEEQGYPDLRLTHITNADLRWEYFPSLREVFAVSVFGKHFSDPIEPVILPGGGEHGIVTYRNSKSARLLGAEVESRAGLGLVHPELKDFSAMANLTLAWSRITVDQTGTDYITHLKRPLVNQAPWVVNLALDYSHERLGVESRLLYNVTGRSLVEVGTEGLDDRYLQPQHLLDLTVSKKLTEHVSLRGTVSDILGSSYVVTQGKQNRDENVVRKYSDGTRFALQASYSY